MDSPDAVTTGSPLAYTITVTNAGPDDAEGVVVTNLLDENVAVRTLADGCAAVEGGVECALGTVAAGDAVSFEISVTVADDAPTASATNDVCDGSEDLCNAVAVSASTDDLDLDDNLSLAATDVLADDSGDGDGEDGGSDAVCGDGVVEGDEECDEPSAEDCSNLFDDDGDLLIDADDPDCQGEAPTCSFTCKLVPTSQPLHEGKALLTFGRKGKLDMFKARARVYPTTPVDPFTETIGLVVSNADGNVWRGELQPGDVLRAGPEKIKGGFKDRVARKGLGTRSGIAKFGIMQKIKRGKVMYQFTVKVSGDFSLADDPTMLFQFFIGEDGFSSVNEWNGSYGVKWKLGSTPFHG